MLNTSHYVHKVLFRMCWWWTTGGQQVDRERGMKGCFPPDWSEHFSPLHQRMCNCASASVFCTSIVKNCEVYTIFCLQCMCSAPPTVQPPDTHFSSAGFWLHQELLQLYYNVDPQEIGCMGLHISDALGNFWGPLGCRMYSVHPKNTFLLNVQEWPLPFTDSDIWC